jgi:hypothetical protein
MKISARPCSRCNSRSRLRYCAWIVRSRLVVGSSAISRRGSQEIPIAPTMRWRIPPDISCGYCLTRVSGDGMRTAFNSARARSHAALRRSPSCTRIGSATWLPIVNKGLSEAIGSCRIIAIFLPRISRISASDFVTRSSPLNSIRPPTMRAAGGNTRNNVSARVLLPEPDSPTIPKVSPASRRSDTSSTARTTRVPWADM